MNAFCYEIFYKDIISFQCLSIFCVVLFAVSNCLGQVSAISFMSQLFICKVFIYITQSAHQGLKKDLNR